MTAGPTRYVKTKEAQAAVEGREIDIVKTLGIPWEAGMRSHIRCPYPSHGGSDDWRLNKNSRAICTCTEPHTDSVFDIIGKMEGLDFEEAKIRAMEIIDRGDLVREKAGGGNYQSTDAESLLNARPENRDDALPSLYLAHRLKVDVAAVLMPTTRTVGLRALAYYDPPKGKGTGKPVHVGDYACAVFEQVDATGRRHAHRIYVEAGGAGKAALGRRADGKERDPKKSAKNPGEESTAGRAAIWGDATRAPWCILAEGVETAAAVAFAFRPEIEAGVAYVASGINAGGVESFEPWPSTERVTVAADRDERVAIDSPNPSRRGEVAARRFGVRHHPRLVVAISLAGEPQTKTDWLNVHEQEGREAVRSGILAALVFAPTTEEIEEERRRTENMDELAQVKRDYPIPPTDGIALFYKRTPLGRIRAHQTVKVGEGTEDVPVCTPFSVSHRLRYVDRDTYGLRILVRAPGGRRREIDVERSGFARQAGADVRAMLLDAGMLPENDGEHLAVKVLKAADPDDEISVVRRPGWHEVEGIPGRFFVCPSGEVIGAPLNGPVELAVEHRISEAVALGGTLAGWQAAVTEAVSVSGCPHWTIGAVAAFAAPLVSLAGLDSCGVSLSGTTSGGKTTSQRIAVSAWSRAALDKPDSLFQTARATANGIEGMAARANATILALDELGHVNGREVVKNIYSLASGVGKGRMTGSARLRTSHTWSTFILLSSEKSLEEKARADDAAWSGGMAARMPDIDVTNINRTVDQATMARIHAVDQHFGHAGPAFVRALIASGMHEQGHAIREGINKTAVSLAGEGADSAVRRAALPFAILMTAGRMARKFGVLPDNIDVEGAVHWAWKAFSTSTDAIALDPAEQAINSLKLWVAQNWNHAINPIDTPLGEKEVTRKTLAWYDDSIIYIPADEIVEAAGGSLKETEIGRALSEKNIIAKRKSPECFYHNFIPKRGRIKNYALRRYEIQAATHEEPAFTVHEGGRR